MFLEHGSANATVKSINIGLLTPPDIKGYSETNLLFAVGKMRLLKKIYKSFPVS